jgi:hypothetical protein
VTSDTEFRSGEQEVLKLLEECAELRRTLKVISAQVGRMENRVKRAFPAVTEKLQERQKRSLDKDSLVSPEEALAEFDGIVSLASSGQTEQAEQALRHKSASELRAMAKELGITFPKSKPSVNAMREAIFGKVRESILLTRHSPRGA